MRIYLCNRSLNRLLDLQVNYLLALSHLLENIPVQAATNEIHKVNK